MEKRKISPRDLLEISSRMMLPVGVMTTAHCHLPSGKVLERTQLAAGGAKDHPLAEKFLNSPGEFAEIPRLINSDRIDLMKEFIAQISDADMRQHLDVRLHIYKREAKEYQFVEFAHKISNPEIRDAFLQFIEKAMTETAAEWLKSVTARNDRK